MIFCFFVITDYISGTDGWYHRDMMMPICRNGILNCLIYCIMEELENEYLDNYERGLLQELLDYCTSLGKLDGDLLESADIVGKWQEFAPEYFADAVRQINSYPEYTVGCAGYIGMAVAKWWDDDWAGHYDAKFSEMLGERGFDDIDDHIVADILGMETGSEEAGRLADLMLSCSTLAVNKIRHENIENQTVMAFHVLARTTRAIFKIGAAIQLASAGYKFEKVNQIY